MLNFEEERAKTKKKIKFILWSIIVTGALIITLHVCFGIWAYDKIQETAWSFRKRLYAGATC
jgi:hypothetical protein